jgi:hypothetical protein
MVRFPAFEIRENDVSNQPDDDVWIYALYVCFQSSSRKSNCCSQQRKEGMQSAEFKKAAIVHTYFLVFGESSNISCVCPSS